MLELATRGRGKIPFLLDLVRREALSLVRVAIPITLLATLGIYTALKSMDMGMTWKELPIGYLKIMPDILEIHGELLYRTCCTLTLSLLGLFVLLCFSMVFALVIFHWKKGLRYIRIISLPIVSMPLFAISILIDELLCIKGIYGLSDRTWIHLLLPSVILGLFNGYLYDVSVSLGNSLIRIRKAREAMAKSRGIAPWSYFAPEIVLELIVCTKTRFPLLFGLSLIVEKAFGLPGLAVWLWNSAYELQAPQVVWASMSAIFVVCLVYFVATCLTKAFDPDSWEVQIG